MATLEERNETSPLLRLLRAIETADRATVAELVRADVRWWIPQSGAKRAGIPLPMEGLDAVMAMVDGAHERWESMDFTLRMLVSEGDTSSALLRAQARTRSGRDYDNTYGFFWRVDDDGRLAEIWELTDTAYLFDVVGL